MKPSRVFLKSLSLDQISELTNDMREWIKDCIWDNLDETEVDDLTDEDLLCGIENHYSGGLEQFIKNGNY